MDEQPDGFITLPPGIVDSGTFKRDRVEPPAPVEREEIVFFPAAPGAPGVPAVAAWHLTLPDGSDVIVDERLFLGRDPLPIAGREGSPVLAVSDDTKSVSKTHAMVEVEAGELWVHDLDSTNGVWVVAPGAEPIEVEPGIRVAVPSGSRLELGDFVMQVSHA